MADRHLKLEDGELLNQEDEKIIDPNLEGGFTIPSGSIMAYGGATSPTGWLLCDGTSYAVATYPDLHTAISDNFGGDGGTNFNVPDLRGRFTRGTDSGAGNDPDAGSRTTSATGGNSGDNVGSLQDDELESHLHTTGKSLSGGGGSGFAAGGDGEITASTATGGNETRPKNVNVNYIIKI